MFENNNMFIDHETWKTIEKMDKDIKKAAETMTVQEGRYLVDFYYTVQKNRIRLENQIRSINKPYNDWKKEIDTIEKSIAKYEAMVEFLLIPIDQIDKEELKKILGMDKENKEKRFIDIFIDKDKLSDVIQKKREAIEKALTEKKAEYEAKKAEEPVVEPHDTLKYFLKNYKDLENNIKICLGIFASNKSISTWLQKIVGIGPVISAALIAYIDINKVRSAGQIMAFGGIDPTKKWEKGQKRPWNANLKVVFWKIGQSFIKTSSNPNDYYGKIYLKRKEYEMKKNEAGDYAEQAKEIARTKEFKTEAGLKMKAIYESGKLPQSHILSRAARFATKIFVSHLFAVWYEMERGELPPKPYEMAILNHTHMIEIPYWHSY